jgi:uncharacterized membrane-anchored protein
MGGALHQAASIAGALLILVAYAAHQAGRMGRDTALYNLVNVAGGALLLWVALVARQAGFIILEGAWTAISLWALVRLWRRPGRA